MLLPREAVKGQLVKGKASGLRIDFSGQEMIPSAKAASLDLDSEWTKKDPRSGDLERNAKLEFIATGGGFVFVRKQLLPKINTLQSSECLWRPLKPRK